jgi:hypothetical protein
MKGNGMNETKVECHHTCRGNCNAIEIAQQKEKEAILEYAALRDECTYPDVKLVLNELIIQRQKSIRFIDELRGRLKERFEVLDQIQEGFNL